MKNIKPQIKYNLENKVHLNMIILAQYITMDYLDISL